MQLMGTEIVSWKHTHTNAEKFQKVGRETHIHTFSHNGNSYENDENDGKISYLIVTKRSSIVTSDSEQRMMMV